MGHPTNLHSFSKFPIDKSGVYAILTPMQSSSLGISNSEFITHNLELLLPPPQKPHRIRAVGRHSGRTSPEAGQHISPPRLETAVSNGASKEHKGHKEIRYIVSANSFRISFNYNQPSFAIPELRSGGWQKGGVEFRRLPTLDKL
jgi:hypothetical protein